MYTNKKIKISNNENSVAKDEDDDVEFETNPIEAAIATTKTTTTKTTTTKTTTTTTTIKNNLIIDREAEKFKNIFDQYSGKSTIVLPSSELHNRNSGDNGIDLEIKKYLDNFKTSEENTGENLSMYIPDAANTDNNSTTVGGNDKNLKKDASENSKKDRNEMFGNILEEEMIKCFYRENSPASLQINSYNNFVHDKIPELFRKNSSLEVKIAEQYDTKAMNSGGIGECFIRVNFVGKETFVSPKMMQDERQVFLYPSTCRLLKENYVSRIEKNVQIQVVKPYYSEGECREEIVSSFVEEGVTILYLPTMVGSILCNTKIDEQDLQHDPETLKHHLNFMNKECCYDNGGYFISSGNEKNVVSQMTSSKNEIMIHAGKSATKNAEDKDDETFFSQKTSKVNEMDLYAEINSIDSDKTQSYMNKLTIKSISLSKFIRDVKMNKFQKKDNDSKMLKKYSKLKKYGKEGHESFIVCYCGRVCPERAIPLPVLLRALGIRNDLEIAAIICNDSTFLKNVYYNNQDDTQKESESSKRDETDEFTNDSTNGGKNCYSTENCSSESSQMMQELTATLLFCEEMELTSEKRCITYIGDKMFSSDKNKNLSAKERFEMTQKYLHHYFLPHVFSRKQYQTLDRSSAVYMSLNQEARQKYEKGIETENMIIEHESRFQKCMFVCHMANKYISVLIGKSEITNRDSFKYKTVEMVGDLMSIITERTLTSIRNDFHGIVQRGWKKNFDIMRALKMSIDKNKASMLYCIATGNWCLNNGENNKFKNERKLLRVGVTQMLNTQNINSKHSCLNIISSSLNENMKSAKPRHLQGTSWGKVCPAETPEGKKVGLVNQFSIFTQNSYARDARDIVKKLIDIGNQVNREILSHGNAKTTPLKSKSREKKRKQNWTKEEEESDLRNSEAQPYVKVDMQSQPFEETGGNVTLNEQQKKDERPKKRILIDSRYSKKASRKHKDSSNAEQETASNVSSLKITGKKRKKEPEKKPFYPNTIFYDSSKRKTIFLYREFSNVMIFLLFNELELARSLNTEEKLRKYENNRFSFIEFYLSSVKVFVNSNLVALTKNPKRFIELCRKSKKSPLIGELPYDCSITFDALDREIHIRCYGGRLCRPLLSVENNKLQIGEKTLKDLLLTNYIVARQKDEFSVSKHRQSEKFAFFTKTGYVNGKLYDFEAMDYKKIDWSTLIEKGIVEYIDVFEEESALVSMFTEDINKQYDDDKIMMHNFSHCEITACSMLGHAASCIPFPDSNQSPRNVYQSAMGKQAQGMQSTREEFRIDSSSQMLWYGQKPLVTTETEIQTESNKRATGTNCVVAIMCYTGYNQEDSIIVNQGSLDRGLFRTCTQLTVSDSIDPMKDEDLGVAEKFCNPYYANLGRRKYRLEDCEHLEENGMPRIGQLITAGMVVIGKIIVQHGFDPNTNANREMVRDCSTIWRKDIAQRVTAVIITSYNNGKRVVHVKLSSVRIPQIGDKLSSRHGQKGTIGMVYREEDMPWAQDGTRPDLIINPHAIPSRMTIAQLVEMCGGTVAACTGKEMLATPFKRYASRSSGKSNAEIIFSQLKECGFQQHGLQVMYHGHTSKMIDQRIFIGSCFYQRLRHNVDDKIQARRGGPKELLTRQPTHGKAKDGGIRFGEMERDCIAIGTPITMRNGLSIPIEDISIGEKIIAWDGKEIVTNSFVSHNIDKGFKSCYKITLEDGRTLVATHNHRILAIDQTKNFENITPEYVYVRDLTQEHRIVCSAISGVLDNPKDDLECEWIMQGTTFSIRNDREKILALARLIGASLTDGHLPKEDVKKSHVSFYVGDELDVDQVCDDIQLVTNCERDEIYTLFNAGVYQIKCRKKSLLFQLFHDCGVSSGRKTENGIKLPYFMLDENCPISVQREFLAAYFGGDGSRPSIINSGKNITSFSLNLSVRIDKEYGNNLESSIKSMEHICNILKNNFNIKSAKLTTSGPIGYIDGVKLPSGSIKQFQCEEEIVLNGSKELKTSGFVCKPSDDIIVLTTIFENDGIEKNDLLKKIKFSEKKLETQLKKMSYYYDKTDKKSQIESNDCVVEQDKKKRKITISKKQMIKIEDCKSENETTDKSHKKTFRLFLTEFGKESAKKWKEIFDNPVPSRVIKRIGFDILIEDFLNLHKYIGVRYCIDKQIKMTVCCAYIGYKDRIANQRKHLIHQAMDMFFEKYPDLIDVRKIEKSKKRAQNVESNEYKLFAKELLRKLAYKSRKLGYDPLAIIDESFYTALLNSISGFTRVFEQPTGNLTFGLPLKTFTEFCSSIQFDYSKGSRMSPKHFFLRIVKDIEIVNDGIPVQVYDLSVPTTTSFIANGMVVHNCIISHGASSFLRDRTMVCSDEFEICIHSRCGMFAIHNRKKSAFLCRTCNDKRPENFYITSMPYPMKLLIQELQSMSLSVRLLLQ